MTRSEEIGKEMAICQLQLQNITLTAQYVLPAQFKETQERLATLQKELSSLKEEGKDNG
jgi:hypothetical protein